MSSSTWYQVSDNPQVLCAWCNGVIRKGPQPASHGICPRCASQLHAELERRTATSPA